MPSPMPNKLKIVLAIYVVNTLFNLVAGEWMSAVACIIFAACLAARFERVRKSIRFLAMVGTFLVPPAAIFLVLQRDELADQLALGVTYAYTWACAFAIYRCLSDSEVVGYFACRDRERTQAWIAAAEARSSTTV